MLKNYTKNFDNENILYNNILLLSRNKLFYTKFNLADTFQNRINLIFVHISFLFTKIKQIKENKEYNNFNQKVFDLVFLKIEANMREIGYGDTIINKNMKFLVKVFYNILLFCENFSENSLDIKKNFFIKYFEEKDGKKTPQIMALINYFEKYEAFCFSLSPDSVLRGDFKFKYK